MQRTNLVGFYMTLSDEKGHKHNYRMTPAQVAREEWETITDGGEILPWGLESMNSPETFKFSSIISDESARNLYLAIK